MRIVDAHAHVYPEALASKATGNIMSFYGAEGNFDPAYGTAAHLASQAKACGVGSIVVSSVATTSHAVASVNAFMASLLADPFFIPLGTLHPDMDSKELASETEKICGYGLYGIKLHPDFQRFRLTETRSLRIFDAIKDTGLPVLVHTGDRRFDFSHPEYMAQVAAKYPQITFIAAHFGGWSEWESADVYADLPNVFFDTSSTLPFISVEHAEHIIRRLGVGRFMFGTDYPMWNCKDELERFNRLDMTENERSAILSANAEKIYRPRQLTT